MRSGLRKVTDLNISLEKRKKAFVSSIENNEIISIVF